MPTLKAHSYPIFISYRRADLSLEAEWLYHFISYFFGEDTVFFDKEQIEGGKKWDETLRTCVSKANIVLVLIGPKWFQVQLETGRRRLDDEEDWVRQEITHAIKSFSENPHNKWIFPVLINGARIPAKEWYPEALQDMASFQCVSELKFDIKDYLDASFEIYQFIKNHIVSLQTSRVLKNIPIKPYDRSKVFNPYELPDFQLPEELRTKRPFSPYKGLEHFKREDSRIFFGRQKVIGELIDLFKKSQHVIRLYGQSGVGKSSLLSAGLFPRLENRRWKIHYVRVSNITPISDEIDTIIKNVDESEASDHLVIIDQVEELITNAPADPQGAINEMLGKIEVLVGINNKGPKRLQLILSYRKEYDVDIKNLLQAHEISSSEYWLKDMDAEGMKEAINGITRDNYLIDEYHLRIEEGLEDTIVNELLGTGGRESVTPLLQILLRKMWDQVCNNDIDKRIFTKELYDKSKSHDLKDLLKERLQFISTLSPELSESVGSGLAIDVLYAFTTQHDTAMSQDEAKFIDQYDSLPVIKQLLSALVNAYLLVKPQKNTYRIPHDSLAKAVNNLYIESQLPGQRARRLLENKQPDLAQENEVEFSKTDIQLLQEGRIGMRKWNQRESKAFQQSMEKLEQQEKTLARLATDAINKANKAQSNYLTSQSILASIDNKDSTKAIRLALHAINFDASVWSVKNLFDVFDKAFAYPEAKLLRSTVKLPVRPNSFQANYTQSKLFISSIAHDDSIWEYSLETRQVELFRRYKTKIKTIVSSAYADQLFVLFADGSAEVYDRGANKSHRIELTEEPETVHFYDAGHIIYHFRASIFLVDFVSNIETVHFTTPGNELIYYFSVSENKALLICTREKKLCILDQGKFQVVIKEHSSIIVNAQFVGNMQVFMVDSNRAAWIFSLDGENQTALQEANPNNTIFGATVCAFNGAGMIGFTNNYNPDLIHLSSRGKTASIQGDEEVFQDLFISRAEDYAATQGHKGVCIWPLFKTTQTYEAPAPGCEFRFLRSDKLLAFNKNQLFRLDLSAGVYEALYVNYEKELTDPEVSENLQVQAFITGDRKLLVTDSLSKESIETALPFQENIHTYTITQKIAVLSDYKTGLYLFRFDSRTWTHLAEHLSVDKIAVFDETKIALGYADGGVKIFDHPDLKQFSYSFKKLSKAIMCLEWSHDGRLLFVGGYNSFAVLCNLEKKTFLKLQHKHWVGDASFAKTQSWVATCCYDSNLRIFDTVTGELLRSLQLQRQPLNCSFIDDDTKLLVSFEKYDFCLEWKLHNPSEIAEVLDGLGIDHLSESEKRDYQIIAEQEVEVVDFDSQKPFKEEQPMKLNF